MKRLLVALALSGCTHAQPGPFPDLEKVRGATAPEGNVVVVAEPADAQVAIDGVTQGLASDFDGVHGALKLSDGPHTLTVSKAGFGSFTATVYASDDGKQRVQVVLEKQ